MTAPSRLQIVHSLARLQCTKCGAEANASCNCGHPYVPKMERAVEAVKANPEKSDRAIAAEIGVSAPTVGKARATVNEFTVDDPAPRVGLDGKVRRTWTPAQRAASEAAGEKRREEWLAAERARHNWPGFERSLHLAVEDLYGDCPDEFKNRKELRDKIIKLIGPAIAKVIEESADE